MRRHSFVERKGSGVTGTGNQAEKERADRTAELSDRLRVLQEFNKVADHTGSRQTGCKDTGRDDDAHDLRVTFTHTVEELLRNFSRIRAGHEEHIDRTEQHGRADRNLQVLEPD